ncbi:aminotransferase class I/II-fold pyridoxal phosphate-dependent enzyme [Mobilicoccus massiliensis]|uniref:aminotransferase class I/II-fold pyridoxal phosphate-dependent enzyme n=1 Tax=Mobilicoccus massiliensis TaxID=1522310 RepID=UPI00058ED993|nr:aminotransferase class I/II-fold pyridoxal phosphate-dependent enzyme [Mobilicoccus massiliensis]
MTAIGASGNPGLEAFLDAHEERRARLGLERHLVARAGTAASESGTALLDLAGNDYLGLLTHPAVIDGAVAAARAYGGGAGASRLVTGHLDLHDHLERALADHLEAPAALVFSTGYHANLAALSALTDAESLVVSDAHAHASLIDGARLSRAEVAVNRHNDVDHVAELLATRSGRRAVVVVESVYSVLGDAAPLVDLVALADAHDATLLVDEAHGLGVVGGRGEGAVAAQGFGGHPRVVVTATLSKSLAAQGGVVAASARVRQHLVNAARAFVYDTGLAPAAAGAALAALDVLRAEPERADRARRNAELLAGACRIDPVPGAVLSVPMPGPKEALAGVAQAAAAGVRIGCFRPPSTPDGDSRLRLTAHAQHTADDLAPALAVLREIIDA